MSVFVSAFYRKGSVASSIIVTLSDRLISHKTFFCELSFREKRIFFFKANRNKMFHFLIFFFVY